MNLLKGSTAYLAGAVEHFDKPGDWRDDITTNLLNPIGVRAFNPLVKPGWMSKLALSDPGPFRKYMDNYLRWYNSNKSYNILSQDPNSAKIWNVAREVRNFCRRSVFSSDFMIVNLPKKFTVGTFEEITIATQTGMPILIHSPDGIISSWLPDMLSSSLSFDSRMIEDSPGDIYCGECHFEDWSSLYRYVNDVDSGKKDVNRLKWLFAFYFNDPLVNNEISNNE